MGIVDSTYLRKPKTPLRRENRIKTIQSSLGIEGNTLSVDQVSAIFDNKRVVGPLKDILEVQNAIRVYQNLSQFDLFDQESHLKAHQMLMSGLIEDAGKYRTGNVGIFKGDVAAHMAPPAWNVQNLMTNLFHYLKNDEDNLIIKSCVFHHEKTFKPRLQPGGACWVMTGEDVGSLPRATHRSSGRKYRLCLPDFLKKSGLPLLV